MELDYIRMVEAAVDGDLLSCLLLLIVLDHQLLGDDLAGEHIVGVHINNFVAFGETTLEGNNGL